MVDANDPRLGKVKSASLADAVRQRFGHRAHVLDLVSPTPGRVLFGEVVTMAFGPLRDDLEDPSQADYFAHYERAVGDEPAGKVLAMANHGPAEAAVAGGTRLARAERDALAGILTDGRLRDFDEVVAYRFAAYCRGETPHAGSALVMPLAVNVPIVLGGATVFPGDHAFADGAGAVILPGGHLDELLDAAVAVEEADAAKVARTLGDSR